MSRVGARCQAARRPLDRLRSWATRAATRRAPHPVNESILLDLHRAAGARLRAEPAGLLTYGDVPAEYAAATEGCALFDATAAGAIDVRGADAVDFIASDTSSAMPFENCFTLM